MEKNDQILKQLMHGDWVATGHGTPMRIVGGDCNADYEGNEGELWGFDEDNPPEPIPLTPEILMKNGFKGRKASYYIEAEGRLIRVILAGIHAGISVCDADEIRRYNRCSLFEQPAVHRLQHALRLCGLGELADNFKV